MPDTDALHKLAKARAIALKKLPYFSTLIYALVPFEAPECESAFVTPGLVMGYNPDFIKKCTEEEAAGLYVHEANHIVRVSRLRIPDGDPDLRQIAADIPINEDIKLTGLALPNGGVFASTYGFPTGKTMEEYYDLLKNLKDKNKLPNKKQDVCNGQCGGIAGSGGSPSQEQLEKELDEQVGRPQADVKGKQKAAAEEIRKGVSAQGRGNVSADLQQCIDLLDAPPKVHWTAELRHTLSRSLNKIAMGGSDYSMSRPSTRAFARDDGIVKPGLVSYEPEILLCLDTSGSMGQDELQTSFREAIGVVRAVGAKSVWFMQADAAVTAKPKLTSIRELKSMTIKGRGGTDFRPAIKHARTMKPKPDILIYFTDGDGYAPAEKPKGLSVVWCVVPSRYGRSQAPAPWGKTIFVEQDAEPCDD